MRSILLCKSLPSPSPSYRCVEKRRAAEEAEDEFLRLLTEKLVNESRLSRQASTTEGNERWTRAKRTPGLDHDPRYDAVGSSSRRAELYIDWAKGLRRAGDTSFRKLEEPQHSTGKQQDKERAMREREEQVRRQRRAAEQQKSRTLGQAVHEERCVAEVAVVLVIGLG